MTLHPLPFFGKKGRALQSVNLKQFSEVQLLLLESLCEKISEHFMFQLLCVAIFCREGDNAADQEKILLKPLCKLVENFASSVISSMIENLSSILSTSNLKTAFSEKMISMSLYFIRLFTSVSLKLGEGNNSAILSSLTT